MYIIMYICTSQLCGARRAPCDTTWSMSSMAVKRSIEGETCEGDELLPLKKRKKSDKKPLAKLLEFLEDESSAIAGKNG